MCKLDGVQISLDIAHHHRQTRASPITGGWEVEKLHSLSNMPFFEAQSTHFVEFQQDPAAGLN